MTATHLCPLSIAALDPRYKLAVLSQCIISNIFAYVLNYLFSLLVDVIYLYYLEIDHNLGPIFKIFC